MPNEIHVQRIHVLAPDALLERGLRRARVGPRRHEAEPYRDAVHVRVNGKVWTIEREEQYARRGLRPDARQRHEGVPEILIGHSSERVLVKRNAAVADSTEHGADADRLCGSE